MPLTILLIEDNVDHINITKRILEKAMADCRLEVVKDWQKGSHAIAYEGYDVILCDYRLPGATALEILKEIKGKGRDLPFVVVTSAGSERAAVVLMQEGAYDYVVKDSSYEDTLPMVIRRSIERHTVREEKKRLEAQINQVAREWEITFNSIIDLVSIHDNNFKFIKVNKAFADVLKTAPEELIGKTCYEIVHKAREPPANCPHRQTLGSKQPTTTEIFEPSLGKYFEVSVSPVLDDNGEVIRSVHTAKDITNRKKSAQELENAYRQITKTQQELIQSSKMAAMGQLAAGISHEINQPLTGIKGFAQAVLMGLDKGSPIRDDLQKIVEQSERIDRIIKNVRFFARKSDFDLKDLDINQPIEDSLMLLGEQLRIHNIRVNTLLTQGLPRIKGDPNQLQQVFLNLITNSKDAISGLQRPGEGRITIRSSLSPDRANIEINVEDSGCGITEENLSNIFNPFFSTKSPDRGTGLGLAIAYRIIENHHGRIGFKSEEGSGTTFTITIPITGNE